MKQSLTDQLTALPQSPGVYIFRDEHNKPLYVGKSVNINHRVRSYFQSPTELPPKTAQMVQQIITIDHLVTDSEIEALLLEVALIQAIRPRYNVMFKDDKRYKFIEVTDSKRRTDDAYPVLTTTRTPNNPHSVYIGPFPDGRTVSFVLKNLRKIFGWCGYTSLQQLKQAGKPCFYFHIKQCPGYCAGKISYQEYLEHMDRVILFLRGKKKQVIQELKKHMRAASDAHNFELASDYRDQIQRLEYITQDFRDPRSFLEDPVLREEHFYFARQQLRQIIGPINPAWSSWLRNLERVEAYDISNLQGTNATGSMVVFVNGYPQPADYRRFRIRSEQTPNDVRMMAEIITRRFSHTKQKPDDESFSTLPQLIVIDGGKTQVRAAYHALVKQNTHLPIIGLAKRFEQIIVPVIQDDEITHFETVTLPHDAAALHLLQHLRDEAHRFAKKYHTLLRKKQTIQR